MSELYRRQERRVRPFDIRAAAGAEWPSEAGPPGAPLTRSPCTSANRLTSLSAIPPPAFHALSSARREATTSTQQTRPPQEHRTLEPIGHAPFAVTNREPDSDKRTEPDKTGGA